MDNIEPTGPKFELGDVYYTLFRHKWKIILCALVGVLGGLGFYKFRPPPYQSSAKLLIRYVVTEPKTTGPSRDGEVYKSVDQRGETIINSELEILTSLDLAEQVAKNIGPEKILAKIDGGKDLNEAAAVIKNGLIADVARNSSIIQIVFSHPDPEIVQVVTRELVDSYIKKHVEIHRSTGILGDSLTVETDQLRSRLGQTEDDLRRVMNKAGITGSLDEFKQNAGVQTAHIRQQIFDTQAELAERSAILEAYTKNAPTPDAGPAPVPIPSQQMDDYKRILVRLDALNKREQELLTQFTEENARVREVRTYIQLAEGTRAKLEKQYPALASIGAAADAAQAKKSGNPDSIDVKAESARLTALQAKIKALNGQLDELRADSARVDQLEVQILELRRKKELDESNYKYYAANLEQSRINDALGNGSVSNFGTVEAPTPAARDSKKTMKIVAGIMGGGIALGFIWAFSIELLFDRSLRRASDVEKILRIPLFLSVPQLKRLAGPKKKNSPALPAPGSSRNTLPPAELASGADEALIPFHETLRDRLISYFESVNLRHKPKLVAVTGLGHNSGVTTTAAGLARSLSETGEGNVLLVDMTQGQGSAEHFYKGSSSVGIDQLLDTRSDAQVQSNLYVVGESSSSERLAKGMPQRFSQLVPKLKASDFDYIIFDMPPVSQISITPRLASFMDMVLMVVESEKTDRDVAQRATDLLMKSKSHLGVVMNKTKAYVPNSLHQDRGFLLGS